RSRRSGRDPRAARRDTSSAARASARATCTARSAARAPGGRRPRGSGAAGSCRRSASCHRRYPLAQLDPGSAVALLYLVRVADSLQHAMQADAALPVVPVHLLRREGPERGVEHAVVGGERDDELVRVVTEYEQRLDPDLQVVEGGGRHAEPPGEDAG